MCRALSTVASVMVSLGGLSGSFLLQAAPPAPYAVVVSQATHKDPAWQPVVAALQAKHQAILLTYADTPEEVLPRLRELFPRHACWVARPQEAGREFVAQVHRLSRRLDEDPYTDLFWGILTGYDAAAALRIARQTEPLTIRKGAAGTEIALEMFEEGLWYCELKQGHMVRKKAGGNPTPETAPPDTTRALAATLTDYGADLFVTSGHATERDWQIGYAYRNGSFRCENGILYGLDTRQDRIPIVSPHPKVYLPVGNCLMGHIDSPDAMALAFMNSAGVCQMFGYTVTTWYGYAGWGVLDYLVEQPGRFTLTEAFFANQAALIHRLQTCFPELLDAEFATLRRQARSIPLSAAAERAGLRPQDALGLVHDRDVVAFYGDPAWPAKLPPQACAWDQSLRHENDLFILEILPRRGAQSFAPLNTNGSQRGGRPIIHYLPHRIGPAQILEGAELNPVITDDFILLPLPPSPHADQSFQVRFRADPL